MSMMALAAAAWRRGGTGPAPGAEIIPVAVSQSSAYGATSPATLAGLRDANFTTGGVTTGGTNQWIKLDLGAIHSISKVQVAGGNLPAWGPVALYLNGSAIQYSTDDSIWSAAATVSGASDSSPYIAEMSFAPVSARYVRLSFNGFIATTEFRVFGP